MTVQHAIRILESAELQESMVMYQHASPIREDENKRFTLKMIAEKITAYFETTVEEIIKKSRKGQLPEVRYWVMHFSYQLTKHTKRDIGKFLGGRDHTTVIYGMDEVTKWLITPSYDDERDRHRELCEIFGIDADYDISLARLRPITKPFLSDVRSERSKKYYTPKPKVNNVIPIRKDSTDEIKSFTRTPAIYSNQNWKEKYV